VAAIVSYYERSLSEFLTSDTEAVVGELATAAFGVEGPQLNAWEGQIEFLKDALASLDKRPVQIYFEFFIPRMGRRADVVLLIETVVVVIEFKVNAKDFDASARNQVHDYALDLKNFHEGHCQTKLA
jgi:hypothetical protein